MTSYRGNAENSCDCSGSYLYRVMFPYCGASEVFWPEEIIQMETAHDNLGWREKRTFQKWNHLIAFFLFIVLNLTLYTSIKLHLKHMNSDFNTDKNTNVNTKTESLRQNEILN